MQNLVAPQPNITPYLAYAKEHYPHLLKPRPEESHKGTFGTVGIIGGAESMVGAALLAGETALYSGCGKVIIGLNQANLPMSVHATYPELMISTATQLIQNQPSISTWLIGCGLGRTEAAARAMHAIWSSDASQIVLDADAIHLLVEHPKIFTATKRADLVLTPHPGEAAHLLDTSINQIQSNRAWAAREIANRYRSWVILKGHDTVISSARGFLQINPTGNAGLATAGSGDVLAGLVSGLLAQGLPAEEAIPAAAWLHGAAAEILAHMQIGPVGLLASELGQAARWLRNRLIAAAQ